MSQRETRTLGDLEGVGKATLEDLELLGVDSVSSLSREDPDELFGRLCQAAGARLDPCVLDVLRCAVAQARDPELSAEERKWWTWSGRRKAGEA